MVANSRWKNLQNVNPGPAEYHLDVTYFPQKSETVGQASNIAELFLVKVGTNILCFEMKVGIRALQKCQIHKD